jgi:hypothetical protein
MDHCLPSLPASKIPSDIPAARASHAPRKVRSGLPLEPSLAPWISSQGGSAMKGMRGEGKGLEWCPFAGSCERLCRRGTWLGFPAQRALLGETYYVHHQTPLFVGPGMQPFMGPWIPRQAPFRNPSAPSGQGWRPRLERGFDRPFCFGGRGLSPFFSQALGAGFRPGF